MTHATTYMIYTHTIAQRIDTAQIERMARELIELRERRGRLWIAGLGGSAANASHAANDFRTLCGIEAYCLTDNVAALTARANDSGWNESLAINWAAPEDALLILSVGGVAEGVSIPLGKVMVHALNLGLRVLGIVGRDGGLVRKSAHCSVLIPNVEPERVTPHTEGWQSVVLHCLCSHPELQTGECTWR